MLYDFLLWQLSNLLMTSSITFGKLYHHVFSCNFNEIYLYQSKGLNPFYFINNVQRNNSNSSNKFFYWYIYFV